MTRRAGLWLAMLALTLQALLPAGYMVRASAAEPLVVLCTQQGAVALSAEHIAPELRAALGQNDHRDDQRKADPCGFAALSAALTAPSAPVLLAPVHIERDAPSVPRSAIVAVHRVGPPLEARGPPTSI